MHPRIHHHRDQIRHFQRPVAERAHFPVPLAKRADIAAMLARVAIAFGRAGAPGVPGIRAVLRNIIVPRKAGGVPFRGPWRRLAFEAIMFMVCTIRPVLDV